MVALTNERERRVLARHPELLPVYLDELVLTVADPDEVRRDERRGARRLFSRWFPEVECGRFIVAAVVTDPAVETGHRILTAYFTRRLAGGAMEWKRGSG